jgi:hypothetical protein
MRPAGCAGDGDLKYVYVAGHDEELFDLAADPDELVDCSGDPASAP